MQNFNRTAEREQKRENRWNLKIKLEYGCLLWMLYALYFYMVPRSRGNTWLVETVLVSKKSIRGTKSLFYLGLIVVHGLACVLKDLIT